VFILTGYSSSNDELQTGGEVGVPELELEELEFEHTMENGEKALGMDMS